MIPCCDCSTGQTTISAGKQVILIGMNGSFLPHTFFFAHLCFTVTDLFLKNISYFLGRYNLSLPTVGCSCGKTWEISISDLVESGYWPATAHFETLYTVDLFTTYEDLKVTAPGMSRQAFVSMLDQRTTFFGRVSISLRKSSTWLNYFETCLYCFLVCYPFTIRVVRYVETQCRNHS